MVTKINLDINLDKDGNIIGLNTWHPINGKWVAISQILTHPPKYYTDGVEVFPPLENKEE